MNPNKLDILLKQDKKLFHTSDLAVLWGIQNRNTLYTTISRYLKKAILFPVHKGLYTVIPTKELDPIKLGVSVLHRFTYLSTESVLAQAGVISQAVYKITLISDTSRNFSAGGNTYLVRKLAPQHLYNTAGIADRGDGVLQASPTRAIADLLYFQPDYHFDATSTIDWAAVTALQKEVGYK